MMAIIDGKVLLLLLALIVALAACARLVYVSGTRIARDTVVDDDYMGVVIYCRAGQHRVRVPTPTTLDIIRLLDDPDPTCPRHREPAR